jgi:hypothetical protein
MLMFAVMVEMRGVSIVNTSSSFDCLLLFKPVASSSQPKVLLSFIKPSSSDYMQRITALDGETQIAPPAPIIQALETLQ